jgi:imidazole glycerol-phosphate synthase subunit HisH
MIAIIDYGAGNIASVQNSFRRLGVESKLTCDKQEIQQANGILIPGVGEAAFAMEQLKTFDLIETIKQYQKPVLGICLGQQLLCKSSEEGNVACLGIFDSEVKSFPKTDILPHMGWNNLQIETDSVLFKGLSKQADVYFVHNYYCTIGRNTIARNDYILPFSAVLQKNNFFGVQFHPEKSGETGELILKNFIELCD